MTNKSLSQQVDAYNSWKQNLKQEIAHYQNWLSENELDSDDIHQRLMRGLSLLQEDQLTIAFVGEYSRGKTELINALIFADLGQRMLPSQAGRTTMCPTELFYDHDRSESYLRLLPIETRRQDKSIKAYKEDLSVWHEIPIDTSDPEKMSFSLQQVASTRLATRDEAKALGFDDSMLELDPNQSGKVVIPEWRHALISLDNALLMKGLRILDTPGLNALGSEPELTISMIPGAQAVVFLLSADAGVTASDMEIWKNYIATNDAYHRAGRFGVLNKIDVLWDDIQGETHTASSIERVRQTTADHLGISSDDVFPLSAKQGLIAKVKGDDLLLQKSALMKLERLISKRILAQKEQLLSEALIHDVAGMLQNSQSILNERLNKLYTRFDGITKEAMSTEDLQDLANKTHDDHDRYYKKLITLQSSRRLMQSQGEILQQVLSKEGLEALFEQTRKDLKDSWSTVGMNRAMSQFFMRLDQEIDNIISEAQLADKMVSAIYQRFLADIPAKHLKPKPFSIVHERKQLRDLKQKSIKFRRNPKIFMMEQTVLIRHFFDTFLNEVRRIHGLIIDEAIRWPDEALLPLMQYTLEQKKLLEKQVNDLKDIAGNSRDVRAQQDAINLLIEQTREQLSKAGQIEAKLRTPPPSESSLQDIVS